MEKLDLLAAWYLVIFLGFVPYATIKSARLARAGAPFTPPPRPRIFRNVLVMEGVFLAIALFAAWAVDIDVWVGGDVRAGALLAAGSMLVLALVLQQVMWRFTPEELKRRLILARPSRASELGWWFLVSLAAGVVEEIVYRGVMPTLILPALTRWTGAASASWPPALGGDLTNAWWLAIAICTSAFVLAHYGQGWMRAAFLVAFSVGCHALVRATGSLLPAMAFHFLYDMGAGVAYLRFARQGQLKARV